MLRTVLAVKCLSPHTQTDVLHQRGGILPKAPSLVYDLAHRAGPPPHCRWVRHGASAEERGI